jgi:hypothetical protein
VAAVAPGALGLQEPLLLVVVDAPCQLREIVTTTLERAGTVLSAQPQITLALRRASSDSDPSVQRLAELLTESVQQNVLVLA